MYICLCAGITDTAIKHAIATGCRTLKDIKCQTGAMAQCCKCCGQCREILRESTRDEFIEKDCP